MKLLQISILTFTIVVLSLTYSVSQTSKEENIGKLMEISIKYLNEGKNDSAIHYCKIARDKAKTIGDSAEYLTAYITNKLNYMYIESGNLKDAKQSCINNYRLYQNKIGTDGEHFHEAHRLLTYCFRMEENFEALDTMLQQQQCFYDEGSVEYAVYLNDVAEYQASRGEYQKAEFYYSESLRCFENINDSSAEYGIVLNNLGQLYYQLGVYDKAEAFLVKSEAVLRLKDMQHIHSYIAVLTNLSYLFLAQKKLPEAEKSLMTAARLTDGKDVTEYLAISVALSNLFYMKKDLKQAQIHADLCLKISKKYYGENNIYYLAAVNNLDVINSKSNAYEYISVLKSSEKKYGKNHPSYIQTLSNLAVDYYESGEISKASSTFTELFELHRAQISGNFVFMSEKEKYNYLELFEKDIESYQNFVMNSVSEHPEYAEYLFENLLFYKQLILSNTKHLNRLQQERNDTLLISKSSSLKVQRKVIADMYLNTKAIKSEIFVAEQNAETLEKELNKYIYANYPKVAPNLNPRDTYRQIRQNLKDNQAIIQFTKFQKTKKSSWDTDYAYAALVLRKDLKYPKFVFLCTEKELATLLLPQNNEPTNAQIKRIYSDNTQNKIFNLLWKSIDNQLSNITELYISPDGLALFAAFEAIHDDSGKLLIDKYKINYLNNIPEFLNQTDFVFVNISSAALFGDVTYKYNAQTLSALQDSIPDEKFGSAFLYDNSLKLSELPETAIELQKISEILSHSVNSIKTYMKTDATETNFKTKSKHSQIIHIATHGFYYGQNESNSTNPTIQLSADNRLFRSGLFMTGAQHTIDSDTVCLGNEDGVLSAYEIENMDLFNTKLIVLSACQTGLGDLQDNEGVCGLRNSLKKAGAVYLLLSLWNVPSYQTTELMTLFYANLSKNLPIETALLNAKLTLKQKYINPFYWAGFVLIR